MYIMSHLNHISDFTKLVSDDNSQFSITKAEMWFGAMSSKILHLPEKNCVKTETNSVKLEMCFSCDIIAHEGLIF